MSKPRSPFVATLRRWSVLCLVLALLAGCKGAAPTPEPVTIRFAHPSFDLAYYQPLAREFNRKNPYITVELVPRNWDLVGGLDPRDADVLITSQFAIDELRSQKLIISLDPLIESDKGIQMSDFYPGAVQLFKASGETWALPAGLDPYVMYYNQDLFDQRGVSYPSPDWTWDDFLNLALALRDPDADIWGYGVVEPFIDPVLFIYQHGGRIFDSLQEPTRTTFDDPLTIEALEWYARLLREHDVAPTAEKVRKSFGNIEAAIRWGKVGMWMAPLSARGGQLEAAKWPMRWGMVPLPRDARAATMATAQGYFITAQCTNHQACWQWIAFLSKQPTSGFTPVRKSVANSTEYVQQAGEEVARIAQAATADAELVRPTDLERFAQVMAIFSRAVTDVIEGRATAEEAMLKAQALSPMK